MNSPLARPLADRVRVVLPVLGWLPAYERCWFRRDLIAGITLAAYAIPVSLAYAALAGLPLQAGLNCYMLGGIAYFLFGSSRHLAVGPTSAISILIGAALGGLALGEPDRLASLAMATALLAGIIGIAAWAFRLGAVVNFVSDTILSGFRVGAGLVIASTQLPKLFGIAAIGDDFFRRVIHLVRDLGDTDLPSLLIGVAALVLLFAGGRLMPGRPVALFVVVLSLAFMSLFPRLGAGVQTVGAIPAGLPSLGWPLLAWSEVDELLSVALACFLLSYVESISVARTFSLKHSYEVSADQELLALGAANVAAGVAQGYPLAGGMSQSAVNEQAGARTPLALLFASGAIGIVLLFFTGLLRNLPQPVLAAVVLFAVRGLIRGDELRHLRRVSRMEFNVALVAMAGVLLFGILKGVLMAVIFSILMLLRLASRPRLALLGRLPGTERFVDSARYTEQQQLPGTVVLRPESGLFYFNAENVRKGVLAQVSRRPDTTAVIIDCSATPNIDLAGAYMLRDLHEQLDKDGISLRLAEVHGHVRDLLQAEGLQERIAGISQRTPVAHLVAEKTVSARTA